MADTDWFSDPPLESSEIINPCSLYRHFRASSAAQNGSALMLLKFFFKTFNININKARCPVEIYEIYCLFKLLFKQMRKGEENIHVRQVFR